MAQTGSYHKILAHAPWMRVYTTNYDNLIEVASSSYSNPLKPITIDNPVTAERNLVVHINGYVTNLNPHSLNSQLKLTHSSYSADSFANSKWSEQLRQDAGAAKAIFFVGYSMADIDISRIFFQNPTLKERTFFVVSETEDEISISPLEEYGNVHKLGIEKFSAIFGAVQASVVNQKHQYTWLREFKYEPRESQPDDKSAIDLARKGICDSASVAWALASVEPVYCVKRRVTDHILSQIQHGKRWFVLHSDLGNGKSLVKEQISVGLDQINYRVFWDTDFENYKTSDLRALSKEAGNIAVFLDATSERFDAIEGILQINIPNIVVFVCVRSTLYELGETTYEDRLPEDYVVFDLNTLDRDDCSNLVKLYNRHGLWGSRARLLDEEKLRFLEVNCSGSISRLIVATFEESEIGVRIKRAADSLLNDRSDLAAIIICSFVVNKVGHSPTPELLSSIINKDVRSIMQSTNFEQAGEFVRYKLGGIVIRSSIISEYLLKNTVKPEFLIWHIENFVRRLSQIVRPPVLQHIFLELQRLPTVFGMIGKRSNLTRDREKEIIVGYFQSISELQYCQRNALFWVHYAMARVEYENFSEASLYLDQAREFARGNQSLTRDVDNHYARLLLDSRVRSDDYNDYYRAFETAHNVLVQQMNNDKNSRHFPYRQASKYLGFIAHRNDKLSRDEKKSFVVACKQVESAISNLSGPMAKSSEISKCAGAMKRAIEIALGV